MAFTSGSFILYLYDYLVLKPTYLCEKAPNLPMEACSAEQICRAQDDGIQWKYQVDWSNPMSLDNWID